MSTILEQICSEDNLNIAFERTCYHRKQESRGGFLNPFEAQSIQQNREIILTQIKTAVLSGDYAPHAARIYYTPKEKNAHRKRLSCDFNDLVVKIAILNVIGPTIDAKLLPCCYANRLSDLQFRSKKLLVDWRKRYNKLTEFVVSEYSKGHKWELID